MMAAIFLIECIAVIFLFLQKKKLGLITLLLTLILSAIMLWYHATDTLKINW